MKTVAICQARMGSTRLPGKVMRQLGHKPLLRWTVDAARQSTMIDEVVLATSMLTSDDPVKAYCEQHGIPCFRGSPEDVLERYYLCALTYKADIVLRFTCDCPFIDSGVIDEVIKLREMTNADYASNCYPPTYPDGLDTECFTFAALETAWKEATSKVDRECQTQFIVRNRDRFKVVNLTCPLPGLDKEHWVCDSANDFKVCEEIVSRLSVHPPSYIDVLNVLDKEPELRNINGESIRNERFYESLAVEPLSPRTFERSQRVFERASKTIPLASQTVSKSHLQYPEGHAPLVCSYGDGGYIFDVDGNRYVDLVGALGPVVLGYSDGDVNAAIRTQLDKGISFSLPTALESELAELLCHHIPCAEMVKFGKSGTDVTTAAVRLARAFTGRKDILMGGYHGWADWSMCRTDRSIGITPSVADHTIHITNMDLRMVGNTMAYWNEWAKTAAAVIVEPNDDPAYLKWLREYCTRHGIVLIFDEILTGFRYSMGGAQKLFGVTPDLACFGKAMGNGMPISALVGHKNIMMQFNNPRVHYSGTFFGDALSIAAAIATINKIERCQVIQAIHMAGYHIEGNIIDLKKKHGLTDEIGLAGFHAFSHLVFKDDKIRSLFMQQMIQNGVLIINRHTLSYAHKKPELDRVITAYNNTFKAIRAAIDDGSINNIEPIAAPPLRAA